MRKENKTIIGFSEEGNLLIGSFEIEDGRFSASFEEHEPFVASEEYLVERIENSLDGLDGDYKFEFCERYDLKPSELPEFIYENEGIEGAIDISLFPYGFEIDGVDDEIYFEGISFGQHDIREDFGDGELFVSEEFFNLLMDTWDKYHLKDITSDVADKLMSLYRVEQDKDMDSLIVKYLEKIF